MKLFTLIAPCVFADRVVNIFREDISPPDSIEDFYLRPLKYLHHDLVPHEVKELAQPPVVGWDKKIYRNSCGIQIDKLDYQNFYDISHSFIFGLIENPIHDVDTCEECDYISKRFGNLQEGIIGLEVSRKMWANYKEIKTMEFWPKIARLLFLYLMF